MWYFFLAENVREMAPIVFVTDDGEGNIHVSNNREQMLFRKTVNRIYIIIHKTYICNTMFFTITMQNRRQIKDDT